MQAIAAEKLYTQMNVKGRRAPASQTNAVLCVSEERAYSVFAPTDGEGFVVVAKSDKVEPIWGYSTEPFPTTDMPDGLRWFLKEMSGRFSHPYRGSDVFRPAPDEETLNNCIGSIARRSFDKAACVRFRNRYYYATVHGKIVAFAKGVKALIVRTFDARVIIVVESVAYAAVGIDDYEFSAEKEENPDNELFIEKHRVNSMELVNYRRKHVSPWNYNAFQKYVEREIDFIERNY